MKILLRDLTGTLHTVADSALGRSGQPWFVPDFGQNWRSCSVLAIRVSRLGKGINPKFAHRHFDAKTLLWLADADGCEALDFMDGRLVCGTWLPASAENVPEELVQLMVDASHYSTLKTGDVIAMVLPNSSQPVLPGTSVDLALDGETVVKFNIK